MSSPTRPKHEQRQEMKQEQRREQKAAPGKTFYFLIEVPPLSLEPTVAFDPISRIMVANLFEGLVVQDPSTLEARPGLADRWEVEAGHRSVTFHLRPGARFSNGQPVTAADAAFSLNRVAEYRGMKLKARAAGQTEVQVTSNRPVGRLLDRLATPAFSVVPAAVVEKGGHRWTRPEHIVSSGAYTLQEIVGGQGEERSIVVMRKNPYYWAADKVQIETGVFIPIMNSEERLRFYLSKYALGEVTMHFLYHAPPLRYHQLKKGPELQANPVLGTVCYPMNMRRGPLDDVRVRHALARAVDREQIIERITPHLKACYALVPENMRDFPSHRRLFGANRFEARRLLAEAGFPQGRDFPRLTITVLDYTYQVVMAHALAQDFREVLGIKMAVEGVDWKEYLRRIEEHDFDIIYETWQADAPDAGAFLAGLTSDHPFNTPGYVNKDFDSLIEAADEEVDAAKARQLYMQAEEMVIADMPVIPLFYRYHLSMVDPSVKDFRESPAGVVLLKDLDVENQTRSLDLGRLPPAVEITPNIASVPVRLTRAVTSRFVSEW